MKFSSKVSVLAPPPPSSRLQSPTKSSLRNRVVAATSTNDRWLTAQRVLLAVWLFQGVLPLALQMRSYAQFVRPHSISAVLVPPSDLPKQTENMAVKCPVQAFVLAGVWWNHDATHYYSVDNITICHVVVPQYNTHGNYVIGSAKTTPFSTAPSSCADDSFPFEIYLYHASVGFYSFYEGEVGTYCTKDKTSYMAVEVLGTYDINGVFLANDRGGTQPRVSYWYSVVGAIWLVYRALAIRRSCLSCINYGRRCDEMGETLHQHEAMVFVQETLRLSAHGATNYHRSVLLYLLVEGIMTDLFLIIANDGWATRVQYVSLGYNLSGLMLLLFEMVENTKWLSEKWRLGARRMFFSYETALVGELVTALVLQTFLSGLNGSDLKRSRPTAMAVSYYLWSLTCHGAVVVVIIGIILSVRVFWAVIFVWLKHRSLSVFSKPCSVDTALGARSRLIMLGGYRLDDGKLYYNVSTLKAFGILMMEEDGIEYLVLHKLCWFTVPSDVMIRIGVVSNSRVEPCSERPCSGIVNFVDRRLGGTSSPTERHHFTPRISNTVVAWSGPDNSLPPSRVRSLFPAKSGDDKVSSLSNEIRLLP